LRSGPQLRQAVSEAPQYFAPPADGVSKFAVVPAAVRAFVLFVLPLPLLYADLQAE